MKIRSAVFALFVSVSAYIPVSHAQVIVDVQVPVFVQPAPVNGYFTADVIMAQLDTDLFVDAAIRSQYMLALGGCIVPGTTFYRPACVAGIQVGGILFWDRVRMYHDDFFRSNHFAFEDRMNHAEWRNRGYVNRDPYGRGGRGFGRMGPHRHDAELNVPNGVQLASYLTSPTSGSPAQAEGQSKSMADGGSPTQAVLIPSSASTNL